MITFILAILSAVAISLHSVFNGIQDHITFYRTHIGKHPYRDFWHLAKHISRASLVLFGVALGINLMTAGPIALIELLYVIPAYYLWREFAFAAPPEKYYKIDESLKISTGITWLDKKLGFHK